MDKPQFYTNEAGEVVELQPVKVDKKTLEADLAAALKEQGQVDEAVKVLEAKIETVTQELSTLNTVLAKQLDAQEAVAEKVAFRRARLDAFNAPAPLNQPPVDAAPSAAPQDVEDEPDDNAEAAEDLANSDNLPPDPAKPREVEVTIKRRSAA